MAPSQNYTNNNIRQGFVFDLPEIGKEHINLHAKEISNVHVQKNKTLKVQCKILFNLIIPLIFEGP